MLRGAGVPVDSAPSKSRPATERKWLSLIITNNGYARVGLLGNPSDGYHGKTISCTIRNFRAQVMLWESPALQIQAHPRYDPVEFKNLADLETVANRDGYYGGLRLLFATCKKFKEFCSSLGIRLPARNFTIKYETDIPRQVGLGGSSAIISAAFKCLMQFYGLSERDIPLPLQPNVVLSVETEELGIAAGLQDRVVQIYGGCVYMDFDEEYMKQHRHGLYEKIDPRVLPPLFLAYVDDPSFSGKVHGDLRFRYNRGEKQVVEAIGRWAGYAKRGKAALLKGDLDLFARLMDRNFDLRCRVLGAEVIGEQCLKMVEIGRGLGHPCKFPGSGGAVLGVYRTAAELRRLQQAYRQAGYACTEVTPE
ncbi:MAG: hypothetical protein COZ06_08010 [Armatimonadetes bacterium CG_4_10_14_3_um_filter_66_18]|nr:hypothetical protein [Armatimonadota bacterium]PIU95890.1 MAG: hypothetical protein COS65_00155 [Armatimonadetes bacterium CG06_land_8_20_14_3_00_66_21]PIX47896.1 MAG: hypothetical protein COZ57_07265 [Armatimonadetes bacterium CG_4_8_14_3_um_filter_66_20]PIY50694.1 MAG: hypothetical protein COZ06_08010 [Armatimonadetes bacterium CG_4_10_14_3_um_filter_66_18]PIZ49348.1 MAG: hypothetical protein COY42_04225 [Armatimonadetes bacterium CG_4_10_14_0_8_um_filter_66_14]PJB76397.1 MAG: hypothetica